MTESQSLVIDGLTRKVGESVTSGDVTVTVDSITVGSSQIWALLDVTGWDFDRDAQYSFDRMRAEIVPDPSGGQHGGAGYGLDSIGITREGAARMLLEFSATISTGNQLNRGDYALEIDLNDLIRRRTGGAEDEALCEGEWSFSIPLAAESLSPTITIDRVQVLSLIHISAGFSTRLVCTFLMRWGRDSPLIWLCRGRRQADFWSQIPPWISMDGIRP